MNIGIPNLHSFGYVFLGYQRLFKGATAFQSTNIYMQSDLRVWDFALMEDKQTHTLLLLWELSRETFRVFAKGNSQGKPTFRIRYETWPEIFAP